VDAYRQPYIPFHLTTQEFFQQAWIHLNPNGIIAINVGHIMDDVRLVESIAATMGSVFPNVYMIDLPNRRVTNTIVVATKQESTLDDFIANTTSLEQPALRHLVDYALNQADTHAWTGEALVFTDDRAPVEYMVDQMILNYVQGR
jgi:spermidine synthase